MSAEGANRREGREVKRDVGDLNRRARHSCANSCCCAARLELEAWPCWQHDDQADCSEQMAKWRSQWEAEMTEKNNVAAELLTLRDEFGNSSATYDKEIEGLKGVLDARGIDIPFPQRVVRHVGGAPAPAEGDEG